MSRLVMKFGGTSVADLAAIRRAAAHVAREARAGRQVAVVVSAMAGTTNQLISWCQEACPVFNASEGAVVAASGEQITAGLLAIVLQNEGFKARSWLGWQLPIRTRGDHGAARITQVGTDALESSLESGEIATIAGFQGVSADGRITTLGRGGSDTSAVAVAAALGAPCHIYTDVDGVYTSDPRIVREARRIDRISYEEMLELASLGAKVLQTRSVEMAMAHHVPLLVRSSFGEGDKGTLVCDEELIMEQAVVTGVTYQADETEIAVRRVGDRPGISAAIFGPLAEADVSVDMIVQNISADGETANVTFTLQEKDLQRALDVLARHRETIGYESVHHVSDVAKVSVVGTGMRSHAGVAARMFSALAGKGINIRAIATSEIKISVLIDSAYTELAVRALHDAYGLDVR